jgi:uncharacterized membrane protein YeaQ/YmgE (transglycosylase-associated protein family)
VDSKNICVRWREFTRKRNIRRLSSCLGSLSIAQYLVLYTCIANSHCVGAALCNLHHIDSPYFSSESKSTRLTSSLVELWEYQKSYNLISRCVQATKLTCCMVSLVALYFVDPVSSGMTFLSFLHTGLYFTVPLSVSNLFTLPVVTTASTFQKGAMRIVGAIIGGLFAWFSNIFYYSGIAMLVLMSLVNCFVAQFILSHWKYRYAKTYWVVTYIPVGNVYGEVSNPFYSLDKIFMVLLELFLLFLSTRSCFQNMRRMLPENMLPLRSRSFINL